MGFGFSTPPVAVRKNNSNNNNTMTTMRRCPSTVPAAPKSDLFHVIHKVPHGHSPYVKAKHAQLIEKDPSKAVSLFWNAINCNDRVDSALKDMAVVMKQLNRPDEAIEAIKSFRHLCTPNSQESLDNVLVELYKCSGRLEEQIEILQLKLKRVEEGIAFSGKSGRLARSQGRKVYLTIEKEYARLLGNLAWVYLQQNDYKSAEECYRQGLSIEPDRNKQCNLAICLIHMNRITEAKLLLQATRSLGPEGQMDESYAKSFQRASQLLSEIEAKPDKENRCERTSTPYKKPCENYNSERGYSWTTTYTPPVTACAIPRSPFSQLRAGSMQLDGENWTQGAHGKEPVNIEVLKSPFTQPRAGSVQMDSENWTQGAHWNEPVNHSRRRLRFDRDTDSHVKGNFRKTTSPYEPQWLADMKSQPESKNHCGMACTPYNKAYESRIYNERDHAAGCYQNTLPVPAGVPPRSPFTQPRARSMLADRGNWRREGYGNDAMNNPYQGLHSEKLGDFRSSPHGMPEERKHTSEDVSAGIVQNISQNQQDSSPVHNGSIKSWADLVEEEE